MVRRCLFVVTALAYVLAFGAPDAAEAHARLERGDPAPGSALVVAPEAIRLTFSEAIEPGFNRASLLIAAGEAVPLGTVANDPANDTVVIVELADPANLATGSYTLVWRVLSAVDGHVTTGAIAFSVGTGQAPANPGTDDDAFPSWSQVVAGWLELVGLVLVVGAFTFGGLIARPVWSVAAPAIARAMNWVWWPSAGGLLIAMLGGLWSQRDQLGGGSGVYGDLLFEASFGRWWLIRLGLVVLLIPLAIAVIGPPGNSTTPVSGTPWRWWLGAVIGASALVTLPLSGHAAATDRAELAVATDVVHLACAAVWLGGLAYLLSTITILGGRDPAVSATLARRFSLTALATMGALIATGTINGALHVAGPRTLTDQDYGVTLIAKVLVLLVVLIAAAINLLITVPRLRAAIAAGHEAMMTSLLTALRVTVALEVIGGAGILIGAAILTELPPADAPLPVDVAARIVTVDQRQNAGDVAVWLRGNLTGQASDRFTITLSTPDGSPPDDMQVQRIIVETETTTPQGETVGDRFDADPVTDQTGTYTFPATRLALNSTWSVDIVVRRAGIEDTRAAFAVDTSDAGARAPRLVDDDWRMPRVPVTTWLLIGLSAAAVTGGIVGLRRLPGLEPMAGGVVLTMAVLIAAGFAVTALRQTVPQTAATSRDNPLASDPGAIQRGASLYAAQCVACHGVTGGGPNEDDPTDDPEHQHGDNADLTSDRAREQRDGDLYYWIINGVPGTEMPAFDHALTEEERWAVVAYLRALQDGAAVVGEAPAASPSSETR